MNRLVSKKHVVFVAILLLAITTLYITTFKKSTTVNYIDTTYKAYILGTVTLTVNEQDHEYQTGDTIDLKSGDSIFFKAGEGYATIEGGEEIITLSAKSNDKKLQLLGIKEKVKSKKITQVFPEITQVFPENTTRSGDGVYTSSMPLDGISPINVVSKDWVLSKSRLPILLQLITPDGKVEDVFKSERQDVASFTVPKSVYCEKNGYTLKISNQRGQVMVNSKLIVPSCKCQCGIVSI